ncbi:hypothetical protein EVAR_86080_1 [Eumeta japonica]|uniref:Uncharacterized protein n=1 Tax=Eumeta variegata TaxID=151549 RepID=A0A4C1UKT2_EUMVA|nr:hypothetical protein EVAR_86080_1 [Eumeta japonica]
MATQCDAETTGDCRVTSDDDVGERRPSGMDIETERACFFTICGCRFLSDVSLCAPCFLLCLFCVCFLLADNCANSAWYNVCRFDWRKYNLSPPSANTRNSYRAGPVGKIHDGKAISSDLALCTWHELVGSIGHDK